MKAHRTDGVSLTFALIFLALAAWWLLAQLLNLALPAVGWIVALALILVGGLGLIGALRASRSSAKVTGPVEPDAAAEPVGIDTDLARLDADTARFDAETVRLDADPARPDIASESTLTDLRAEPARRDPLAGSPADDGFDDPTGRERTVPAPPAGDQDGPDPWDQRR